jgi:DNA-binding response OmpR family regulator
MSRGEHCSLSPERPASRNRTTDGAILIVDLDSHNDTTGLVQTLAAAGYHVFAASQLMVGLNLLTTSQFALVLVNSDHIGVSLEGVCFDIAQVEPALSIIVLGPRVAPASKVRLLELGADDYIPKPFDAHELLARLASAIRRARRLPTHND